ncbi:MAG: 1,4-dihydroxy-2-naphthoate polyprenyltransferase [Anaerolineae bacterium]
MTQQLHAWILAARPRTLPASVAPVIVGAAVAVHEGAFRWPAALAALIAALLIQIGSNFANDLGDFYRGADRPGRVGPTRVTSAGLLTPRQVQMGIVVVFGAAALCGLYLIAVGGWPILAAGVLAIIAALAYTLGPVPFGYYGLGDLAVFVFFGLVAVVGTAYVQTHQITPLALAAAVPMGCLITNILVVNNLRDIETDRAAGKRTLAVLLGRRGARGEYILLLVVAYAVPFVLWLGFGLAPWVLLPLVTLPLTVRLIRTILTTEGAALNRALAETARLVIWFAVALAAGLAA